MCSWNREQTMNLIELHSTMECLYNHKHPEYLNRSKKSECWREITNLMQDIRPGSTIPEVKLKIKTLRNQFLVEGYKVTRSQQIGSDNVYVPKLWCYNELKYMDQKNYEHYEIPQETTITFLNNMDDCTNSAIEEVDPQPFAKVVKKPRSRVVKSISTIATLNTPIKESYSPVIESSISPFLKNLECELLELDKETLQETKWKILDIVKEAQQVSRNIIINE